jgi:hypothetical protein
MKGFFLSVDHLTLLATPGKAQLFEFTFLNYEVYERDLSFIIAITSKKVLKEIVYLNYTGSIVDQ